MAYSTRIIHKSSGRLRLQMDDPGVSLQDMRETLVQLQSLAMEQKVRGNPLTRTILLEDDSDVRIQEVLDKAQESGVIQLRPHITATPPQSLGETLHRARASSDRFLQEITDGKLNFKSALALTFMGLGINQGLRDKFMPAGLTLIFYAIGMIEIGEMSQQRTSEN